MTIFENMNFQVLLFFVGLFAMFFVEVHSATSTGGSANGKFLNIFFTFCIFEIFFFGPVGSYYIKLPLGVADQKIFNII